MAESSLAARVRPVHRALPRLRQLATAGSARRGRDGCSRRRAAEDRRAANLPPLEPFPPAPRHRMRRPGKSLSRPGSARTRALILASRMGYEHTSCAGFVSTARPAGCAESYRTEPRSQPPPDQGNAHGSESRNQRFRPHRPPRLPRPRRAGPARQGRSTSSPSATSCRPTTWPTCSSTTRRRAASTAPSTPRSPPPDKAEDDVLVVNGKDILVVSAKTPAELPWAKLGRAARDRVDRPLHRRREGQGPPRRRRQEGDHLRARQGRGHHGRAWA